MPSAPSPDNRGARAEALRARMAQRLDGARFRYLNEQLYSGPSSAAQRLFQEDPETFLLYHRGFQNQVKKWPLQPVDRIARDLRQRLVKIGCCEKLGVSVPGSDWTSELFLPSIPRPASLVVADFGCGDCRLASSIRNPVHCFDLASLDPRVTVCDMAQVSPSLLPWNALCSPCILVSTPSIQCWLSPSHNVCLVQHSHSPQVPLEDESIDVAVFCLSLMGTNIRDFLEEANRVLKPG